MGLKALWGYLSRKDHGISQCLRWPETGPLGVRRNSLDFIHDFSLFFCEAYLLRLLIRLWGDATQAPIQEAGDRAGQLEPLESEREEQAGADLRHLLFF